MKNNKNKAKATLVALMMISMVATLGACGSTDTASSMTSSSAFPEDTYTSEAFDSGYDDTESASSDSYSYEYKDYDNDTYNNYSYDYDYNYEEDSSSDYSDSSYEDDYDSGYEDDYDSSYESSDYEYTYYEEEEDESSDWADSSDDSTSDDADYDTGNYGVSDTDYAEDALVSTNDFEINPLPARVGGTNAVVKANVINRSGKHVTAVGCTLYYSYGGIIKSTLISDECDYDSFNVEFDINDYLGEKLNRGGMYLYRIFVEADGVIYTHDCVEIVTNEVDDKIEIEQSVDSVSSTSASVNAKIYNPTGAKIDAIGCKFGDGLLLLSEDKVTGSFTDSEISETFTFTPEDGEFPSDKEYNYEVFVRCGGNEYTIGMATFTTPLY